MEGSEQEQSSREIEQKEAIEPDDREASSRKGVKGWEMEGSRVPGQEKGLQDKMLTIHTFFQSP